MSKVIGKEAPVTDHAAEVKTLLREGIYPHPPVKILMNEVAKNYFSIKVQGRQSPMVLVVESYENAKPTSKSHDGFELYWSLSLKHPSGDATENDTNGAL